MKKILSVLLAGIIAMSFAACGNENDSSTADTTITSQTTTPTTESVEPTGTTITDREGNDVEIPAEISKIISTSPSTTEVLVGLGLSEKIIATDTYSDGTEGLKPGISTLDMRNLDMEQIIALKPDAVFLNEISLAGEEDKYASLKDAGIKVLYIPAAISLQGIMDDITFISQYTKTDAKGQELVKEIKDVIELVDGKVKLRSSTPPKVYFEIGAAPYLYSFGSGTYLNEIITLCGGVNIYADQDSWFANTDESVIKANPDVIISNIAYDEYSYTEIYDRAGWNVINAVKNKNVVLVDTNATSRASQNIVKGIKEIANAIYPGTFE